MNGKVIFGMFMMVWSIAWAVAGGVTMFGGFNAGLFLFWLYYTIDQAAQVQRERSVDLVRETLDIQAETIRIQQQHIDYLKGQR